MDRATPNQSPLSQAGSPPTTISISPSQHLDQLPIAALLAFVPRLHTTFRVINPQSGGRVATSCTHYRIRLATGQILSISDNLLDLVRLIDGRRSIQALSDALAERQSRPVHPAEIVYLIRHRLAPGGLVELSLPLALPEPRPTTLQGHSARSTGLTQAVSEAAALRLAGATDMAAPNQRHTTSRPIGAPLEVEWIPPGRRAERLRATRRPSLRAKRRKRASYINLVATFLVVLAAGAAFAFAHAGFSHASFIPPSLSDFFGAATPTITKSIQTVTPTPTPPLQPIRYVVQGTDTLPKIAAHFHVNVTALLLVNNMNSPAQLQDGQVLIIPTVYHPGANLATLAYPIFYVVQQGDNLSSIAQSFGDTYQALIQSNHLTNPNLIKPGDALVIPAPTPSS